MSTTPSFLTVTVPTLSPTSNYGTNLKAIVASILAHDPNLSIYRINTDTSSQYDVILSVSTFSDVYFRLSVSGHTAYVHCGGMDDNQFSSVQSFTFTLQATTAVLSFGFLGTIGLSLQIQISSGAVGYLRYLIVTDEGGDNHLIGNCTSTQPDGFNALITTELSGPTTNYLTMQVASPPMVWGEDQKRYLYPYAFCLYNNNDQISWYNCRYDGKRLYRLGTRSSLLDFPDGTVVEVNGTEIPVVFRSVFVAMNP